MDAIIEALFGLLVMVTVFFIVPGLLTAAFERDEKSPRLVHRLPPKNHRR